MAKRIQGINRGGVKPQGNLAGRQAREGEVDGAEGGDHQVAVLEP